MTPFLTFSAAIWCAIGLAVHATAVVLALRYTRRPAPEPHLGADEPASILVPVKGADAELGANLRTMAEQERPGTELLVAVGDGQEDIVPEIDAALAGSPVPYRILTNPDRRIGANPKINTLAKAYDAASGPLLLHCDANVRLAPETLQDAAARLEPDVGMVTAWVQCVRPSGIPAHIEAAFLNGYQARFFLASAALGRAHPLGKMMLYRRSMLESAGGIEQLARNTSDDTALEKIVSARGLRVALCAKPLDQPLGRRRFRDVWDRQLRWLMIRRRFHAWAFVGELLICPALLVALAGLAAPVLAGHPAAIAAGAAGALYAAESVYIQIQGSPRKTLTPFAWLARDLLLPALWLSALLSRRVDWRGSRISIGETPEGHGR